MLQGYVLNYTQLVQPAPGYHDLNAL